MNVLYFLFVVWLSACGLRSVDCEPVFTSLPNGGNPVYQLKGQSVSLTWSYNTDGRTVNEREWTFNINQRIATWVPSGTNIDPAYTSRAVVQGDTLGLSNIQEKDTGNYQFRVEFASFNPRFIINQAQLIVVVAPQIILPESGPITIDEGNDRTLLCVASGNPKPLITWYRGNVKVQEDAGNSNYTISSAKRSNTGRYKCVAAVTAPGLIINTAEYTVDVTVRFKPEHKVNSLSSNQTVVENRDAEFNCRTDAVPDVLDYRWFKDGNQISESGDYTITSITDGERLTVKQAKKTSTGLYSCDGRNALGTGKKKSAYLIVNYAPQQVTVTPADPAEVLLTQSITLTCQADGFPNPSYSWKFNGQWNGVTQNTLTITNADVQDAGNYTCHARNTFGFKETTKVVYVRYKPTVTKFTTGTPGNTVVEGTTVTLTCSANGYPAPTYTIKRQNTPVVSNGGKFEITDVQLSEEENTYSCETQNAEGSGPTEQLKITVLVAPTFPSQQLPTTKQTKTENETVSYSCRAEAKPAATILWQLDRKNLTETSPYNFSVSVAPIFQSKLLKTLAYLTIDRVTWRQNGYFSCLAYNDAGEKSQTTELEVRYRPVAQTVADQPKNLTLDEGETANFTCKTTGNPSTETHKWQFNGKDIPGESCSGCSTTTFVKSSVTLSDAGWYSCTGTNSLGEGPPARAQLLIKYPPEITFYQSSYTVNETSNVTLVCRANGVPQPRIIWTRSGSSKELAYGEQFLIVDTKGSDDGTYRCIAKNDIGQQDSVDITLNVQTRPTIVTSTPIRTQIPGAAGEQVDLTCIVNGKPPPSLSWKRDLNAIIDLTSLNDDKVKSIISDRNTSILKVTVTNIGEKFYCIALNLLGSDNQQYTIRERGVPDAPIDLKLAAFKVEGAKTVSVNVSWTPGYSGGYDQMFTIHYREKGTGVDFVEQYVGHPDNNMHTIQGLLPETEYEFTIQASNQAGEGEASALNQVKTPESSVPPDRGSVEATRMTDDTTVILVTWTVTDKDVTILNLEIQEGADGQWEPVPGGNGLSTSETELKVTDLKAGMLYRFRMDMRKPGEQNPVYVLSNTVAAEVTPYETGGGEPLQDWMIAVIAGVAGVLLLAIVVLALCCFKRRKKARGDDNVHMSQTSNYAVGGPDVTRPVPDTRRSYGMESVEDDPFIVAASMQSMTSNDGKKKKQQDPSVNYGYLSQDSVQQPEVLLNPGSRLMRNGRLAQSTGELDMNSAYPARGPQRDFNTLPPYHEPPSFEEAMRQSARKPKTRKSTGDLTGPGQGRHPGRSRPRQARPADEPTDSSDGEQRFTPQRTAPPPPRVRHVESTVEPRYAPVDQQAHVLGSRVLPSGHPTDNGPRRGPLDPSGPYALPQKKNKPKKPRHEPAIGPPPQYTPEDLSPEDPMLQHPGDLDLDDPSSLPLTERPPDLPPPMAMLRSNRPRPSNYHDDPQDGLPEPPSFLRDIVYPTDSDRDPRYDSDGAMPYHPPSPGRQRQPYVNVHGQLVRPNSQDSIGFRRPESLRSSRDALTPEPEIPPNQSRSRGSESDDNRGAPEMNYVSYLV